MFWRRRSRLDEEIASHVDEETADNIARGLDPEAARAAAGSRPRAMLSAVSSSTCEVIS
jgi:hypothetical protein